MNADELQTLATAAGIDIDTDGDIWGSTNGALARFAEMVEKRTARRCAALCEREAERSLRAFHAEPDADKKRFWNGACEAAKTCAGVIKGQVSAHEPTLKGRFTMSTDNDIEQEIQAKGLTAPRITPADIEANIVKEVCFTAAEGIAGHATMTGDCSRTITYEHTLLTFCVLTLRNGFTVTGESACVSPENVDAEVGRKTARANAVSKVWPLMGYKRRRDPALA